MAQSGIKLSYAAAASHRSDGQNQQNQQNQQSQNSALSSGTNLVKAPAKQQEAPEQKWTPDPTHIPKTSGDGEAVFVLTLLTDAELHRRMTGYRNTYFPEHLNKLAAHLTLFHALPGSKLADEIIPVISRVAADTQPFPVHAASPFRLKKGIAISVPKHEGGEGAQKVHQSLQEPWVQAGFLSDQDKGGCRVHYTIMNKVDDEARVEQALEELRSQWTSQKGHAEGLGLWRYDKGFWRWERGFRFRSSNGS